MRVPFAAHTRSGLAILGVCAVAITLGATLRRPAEARDAGAEAVSLMALIVTPERFDNRKVRVIGAMRLAFEGDALYLHREDMELHIPTNAVWLSFGPDGPTADQRALSGGYVGVEGVFSSRFKGHWGRYAGSIKEVARIEKWPPPELDVRP